VKVAALYDVHGNLPALEAVLADVEREGVDAVVFGGDIAAGPPSPLETVELARSVPNARWVRGNADRLEDPQFEGDAGLEWLLTKLEAEQVRWLTTLPFSTVLDSTLYVHAAPQDDETVITELTSDERLAELLADVTQRRIVAGHTHMQLERRVGDRVFVNAGSVGRPYEASTGAYWAVVDGEGVAFRRTTYDLGRAAELVRRSGHPRAEELAAENVLRVPSRTEALAVFGG
jgi:putative phosphoesterase